MPNRTITMKIKNIKIKNVIWLYGKSYVAGEILNTDGRGGVPIIISKAEKPEIGEHVWFGGGYNKIVEVTKDDLGEMQDRGYKVLAFNEQLPHAYLRGPENGFKVLLETCHICEVNEVICDHHEFVHIKLSPGLKVSISDYDIFETQKAFQEQVNKGFAKFYTEEEVLFLIKQAHKLNTNKNIHLDKSWVTHKLNRLKK